MSVICCFSVVAFNILSLSLIFVSLITMCLSVFLLGFVLPRTHCASWTWLTISFPMLGKFSAIISSNIFSDPLSHHLLGPYNVNVGMFYIVPDVPYTILISFHSSFIPLFCSSNFYQSVLQLTYSFFCLLYSILDSL